MPNGVYAPQRKNQAFKFTIPLDDLYGDGFKVNPTIAAGDFKVDKDQGGLNNLSTTPIVSPSGSTIVLVSLSATEMNADMVTIVAIDQSSPKEWADIHVYIPTVG